MKKKCLFGIIVAFFVVILFSSCKDNLFTAEEIIINVDDKYHIELNKDTLLSLVNMARTSGYTCHGVYYPPIGAVKWNEKCEEAARLNSDYMFQFNILTHVWSDGTDAGDHLTLLGYNWQWFGDNAAHGNMTEETVIQGWLNSPAHCKNIMDVNFRFMGVAQTENYWTQVFTD